MTKARSNAVANAVKGDLTVGSGTNLSGVLGVGNNGETLVADSSTTTGLSYQANFAAGKNKIINGAFNVNQRNFTSSTVSGSFNFDRWIQENVGGTCTVSAQTFTLGTAPVSGYESRNFYQSVTSGQSGVNDYSVFYQKIESVRTLAGQTATISFWAKATTGTPKVAIEIGQNFADGSGGSAQVNTYVGQVTLSTSWARYSVTLTVPSIAGKTIGTFPSDHLSLSLWVSAGSTFNARTGSLGIQNNTFQFWGFQAENGSVATAFQTASGSIDGELSLCQRYYWRTATTNAGQFSTHAIGSGTSATSAFIFVANPRPMRTTPASVDFANLMVNDTSGSAGVTSLTIVAERANCNSLTLQANVASGLTQFRPYFLLSNASTTGYIGLSAEL